ncbi:hypothetical protein PENTCL1PPCAC_12886, partial [Pristionchus entomophagus]
RARVNKRLDGIEKDSKYSVDNLVIKEVPVNTSVQKNINEQHIVLFEGKSYSIDFIKRIAHNASIDSLTIELTGSDKFHRDLFNLSKDFKARRVNLVFKNDQLANEMIVDSFILDLTRSHKELSINRCGNITAEGLQKLYKIFNEESTEAIRFSAERMPGPFFDSFIRFIGVSVRDGEFYSERDIELFGKFSLDCNLASSHFFDGNIEIGFQTNYSVNDRRFWMILHKTRESLESAKRIEGFERINVNRL